MTDAEDLRYFADTLPEVYPSADLDEASAQRRAVVLALLSVLASVLLTIGAISSLFLAFR